MRHCPNCDGEVIVWDTEIEADKCLDCGESWLDEVIEVQFKPNKDIPDDAWAFRLREWRASTAEYLHGEWHRTEQWIRRDGIYAGLVSVCNRVYSMEQMELVGAPDQHPMGALCVECFGIDHSDKVKPSER